MERHGDLNKPAVGPEGRLRIKQQWETLTDILNLDVTGDSKDKERWKKMSHTSTSEAGPPVPSSTLDDSTHCTSLQSESGSSHIQTLELLIPDLTPPIAAPRADSPGPVRQSSPTPRPTIESPPAATRRRRLFRRGSVSRQRRPTPLLDTRRRRVSGPPRLEEASAQLEYFDQRWHVLTQQIAAEHRRLRERQLDERQAEREQRREEMAEYCVGTHSATREGATGRTRRTAIRSGAIADSCGAINRHFKIIY
ncbi:uncharacterized protein [Epargyreus clarus]|uniref:uncharacterized protein n=1 Tax=Epargyreus clarus TaxID=520877 RepID=UPI003C2B79FE